LSHQFNFVLKKLVLIDSAGFCYSEIELDKHTILLGEGNVGKSSLLNCIRLFLLPEVNFNRAKDKFNFKSSNGYEYDKNESFGHYFPSKYSHLIIEVEKVIAGKRYTHCQILNRGKNLSFERIFTALPYQEIQHLFWQVEDDDEHNIGSRVEKLSTQDVFTKIKAKDKHCISVRDPQKLKDLMYARDILSETEMRYSLFPLNDASDENVESLRALILMLFDMETSNEGVAKAVANIVESEKKETSDALNFDIQSFLAAHDSLKLEEQKLTDIENKTKEFEALESNFAKYRELSEIESRFVDFYLHLSSKLCEANRDVNGSANKIKEFQQQLKPIVDEIKVINQNLFTANKIIKSSEQNIAKTEHAIEKGNFELARYVDMTQAEVIELLDEELIDTQEKIQAYQNTNARRIRINKLETEIAQYRLSKQNIELEIANSEFAIQKQLPNDTLDLLNSINSRLLLANPGKALEKHEVDAIENFKGLFTDQGYLYNFWGQEFRKSDSRATRNLQRELENIEAELNAAITEKSDLEKQDAENPLVIEKKLQELGKELKEIKRVKKVIFELNDNISALKVYNGQLAENQTAIDEMSPQITSLSEQQGELSELIKTEQQTLAALGDEQSLLLTLENKASGTKHAYPKIQKQLEIQSTINNNAALTSEYLSSLQRDLQQVDQLRVQILEGLRDFARDKFIDLDDDLFNSSPVPSTIHQAYNNVKQIYDELAGQWQLLKSKTRSHNESVSNYVDILEKNFEHISRFENQLNRSFEGISVNDLTQIEVSIHIEPRFKNLISEIQKSYNEFSEQALSEQFYLRLQAFSNAFFKDGERYKLVMSDVIKKVSYRVKKDGHDSWQTKQQSTSTTALINLKLVRILLAKLRADSCMVKLPVIMDEAANINVNQYEWLLRDIKDSGFYLFTAGTHSSGAELVHMIGNHYDVDALKTAKPYTAERARVVWDGPQSFYDEESFESFVEDDQIELLEGVNETI
jgi:DNA repair exonuclease SbcCD ATPase subunit